MQVGLSDSPDHRLTEAKSHAAGWKLGEPGMGGLTGVVIESKHGSLKAGDAVAGNGPWWRYNVLPGAGLRKIGTTSVPASAHWGAIGMPGLSAYFPRSGSRRRGKLAVRCASLRGSSTVVFHMVLVH